MARILAIDPGTFSVQGIARPKGSTRSFPHARTGKMITIPDSEYLQAWEAKVRAAAKTAWSRPPLNKAKAIALTCTFYIGRPQSHYGTGRNRDRLKANARQFPTVTPDLDKLLRAVLDSLTGVVYEDDCQVVKVEAIERYAQRQADEVVVTVAELTRL